MNETAKTLTFIAIGALALVAAYFVDRPTQAVNVETLVGATLNADIDVDEPKRLRIVKFDRETASTRQFEVAAMDDGWRIPSKQDYPADATEQMAAAANALIDRRILRIAAQTADDHAKYGVVDPMSSKLDTNSQGVGTRVVMTDADDKELVDMIIGEKVKDSENQRYVRKTNQDVVYVVELDPASLSTNFDDWIEDDLLKLSPFDIRRVFINDYSAELSLSMTADGRIAPRVSWDRRAQITVGYNNDDAKWELAELKTFDRDQQEMVPATMADDEEVNQDKLGELRNGLDDLVIVDVVRKPEGLSADLKAGNDFLNNNEAFQDLVSKGFSPVPLQPGGEPEILSSEGEVICTLRDGVEYVLRIGKLQVQPDGESTAADAPAADPSEDAAADSADEQTDEDGKNLRRYLFVMARFNEDIIEKPQLKELPPPPAGDAAEPAVPPAPGGDQGDAAIQQEPTDETSPDQPADDPAGDLPGEAGADEAAGAAQPAAAAAGEPSDADKLAAERKAIEEENKRLQDQYQETVEAGKKRVAELNERFGDWYYVISNDVYKQIHLGRDDVIRKKAPADGATPPAAAGEGNPLSGLPNLPLDGEAAPDSSSNEGEADEASPPPAAEGDPVPDGEAPASEPADTDAAATPGDESAPASEEPQPENNADEASPPGNP